MFKLRTLMGAAAVAATALTFGACQQQEDLNIVEDTQLDGREVIPGKYLVKFHDNFLLPSSDLRVDYANREDAKRFDRETTRKGESTMRKFFAELGIEEARVSDKWMSALAGFAAELTDAEVEALKNDPRVEIVEPDYMMYLEQSKVEDVVMRQAAQTTPCGIPDVGGADTNGPAVGGAWAWVIDSGIDLNHPDLNVVTNTSYAKSYVGGSAEDCNGHGTHVAGTIAAINNSIGVIGVVPNMPVVPVRVFGCSGGSASSTIINGINHAAANDLAGDVANLSLGGYYGNGCSNGSTYRSAVLGLDNQSWVAIAAGNSSANAAQYQPACINSSRIRTVASMTCSGSWSSFSNYNMNPIDVIAPGSSIYSTYKNGGYATLSGTSMATPHVAGIMASRNALPRTSGSVSYRGESYPKAVR